MRMLLLLYGMCFCGVFIGQNKAMSQTNDPDGIVLRLEPYGRAESQEIQVAAKATLLVSPEGESGLEVAPAIFVLAEELVAAKNDEGTKAGYFRWSPESVQTVKVLLVNNAPRPIAYRIKVTEQIVRNSDSGKAAGHTIFRLYYATDREPAVDPRYAPYFGGKPAESGALSFGICEVSIPRDHRMGRLEIPSMWRLEFSPDPDKHVSVLKVTRRPESAFLGEIRGRVATAPGKQILVFIHGYNTTFDGAAKRTAQISYDLGFDGATVLYSWPSQGELTPIAYNQDQRNSELTTARFEALLEKLVSETGPQQIQVIAHSMGTPVISKALADFAAAHNAKPLPIKNVALMAPDIDAEVFRQISGQSLRVRRK